MANLLKEERQQPILETVRDNRRVAVDELSQRFDVSEVTIRRDLRELDARGVLRRAHSGTVVATLVSPEPPVVQRMAQAQRMIREVGVDVATSWPPLIPSWPTHRWRTCSL